MKGITIGLVIIFINLISAVSRDNIQINNIIEIMNELAPSINSLILISKPKILDIPLEKYDKNHSDKPV